MDTAPPADARAMLQASGQILQAAAVPTVLLTGPGAAVVVVTTLAH